MLNSIGNNFRGKYKFTNFVVLPTGKEIILEETDWIENLITSDGRTLLLNRFKDNTQNAPSYIAIGTGAVAPSLTDHALGVETYRSPITAVVNGTGLWNIVYSATFTSSQINFTTEIGLVNASSAGTLVTRSVHSAISIPTGSSLRVDYTLTMIGGAIITNWAQGNYTNTYKVAMATATAPVVGVSESIAGVWQGYTSYSSELSLHSAPIKGFSQPGDGYLYIFTGAVSTLPTNPILVNFGG